MAWTYTQNFDALNTADLNGQDGWVNVAGSTFSVQESVYYGGSGKAVKKTITASGVNIKRDIDAITTGKMNVYMRKSSNSVSIAGTILGGRVYVLFNNSGNITAYNNDATPAYDILQAYSADIWYKITIEFDSDANTFSVWVDDVSRATDFIMGGTSGSISKIAFDVDDTGADTDAYWDNIEPWAAAGPTITIKPTLLMLNVG